MHSTSTLVLPDSTTSGVAVEEPTLFDNSILDPRISGRPWSIVNPPLATVPPSTLRETPGPSEDVCDDDLYETDILPPSAQPDISGPRSDADGETPPLEETSRVEQPAPMEEIFQADLDGDIDMTLDAPSPRSSLAVDYAAVPTVETPPPAAPAGATVAHDQAVDDQPAETLFASAAAPCDAPSGTAVRSARPAVAPKRIGSGCLVPARLTWKPRDPFAAGRRSSVERFRWELMLTSACITAVSGLGCVWLLRTLLA